VIVLGLDPGFASCGYAELDVRSGNVRALRMGTLRTTKSQRKRGILAADDDTRRARELSSLLGMMVKEADVVCSEALSHGHQNATTGIKVGISWGVVVAHVQAHAKPLLTASPAVIRQRLGLVGTAGKDDLRKAMASRYGKRTLDKLVAQVTDSQRVHAYDALAAATACLDSDEVRLLLLR